jgi:MYXO-CTERM domain-containing protein
MLAPYAKRPVVTIMGLADGATATDAMTVTATATDSTGAGIAKVQLFVDGALAAEASADTVSACVKLPAAAGVQVLAVAQTNKGAGPLAKFPPKGWTAIHATGLAGGATTCSTGNGESPEPTDDAGTGSGGGQGGCSCRAEGATSATPWGALGLALAAVLLRGRKTRGSASRRRG